MTYEEIAEEWGKDGKIDLLNLENASYNIPILHNKYYKLYVEEDLKALQLRKQYSLLKKLKMEYYSGQLDDIELKDQGWEPFRLRVLRQDIPDYLESDKDLIDLSLRIGMRERNAAYLKSIISEISNMRWSIRNIIEHRKFEAGSI